MLRARKIAVGVAGVVALLSFAPLAGADDAAVQSVVVNGFIQLASEKSTLTQIQTPMTAAALKSVAAGFGTSGAKLVAVGSEAVTALKQGQPSTSAGAKAKTSCLKFFGGVLNGGKLLVTWSKAELAGTAKASALTKLRAVVKSVSAVGVTCGTLAFALK